MSASPKFRLQRVLELREQAERARAVALAQAEQGAQAAREEREALRAARDAQAEAAARPGDEAMSVGMLRHARFVLEALDLRIGGADQAVTTAESLVRRAQDELREAFVAKRALELLKEKHVASAHEAERTADRQRMDDIALTRFHQQGDDRPTTT